MQVIDAVSEIDKILSQLDEERLRAISLIKLIDDTGLLFSVTTTKRETKMIVGRDCEASLRPLVITANDQCIGVRVVYLTVSEEPCNFELVLENGFSIRTLPN